MENEVVDAISTIVTGEINHIVILVVVAVVLLSIVFAVTYLVSQRGHSQMQNKLLGVYADLVNIQSKQSETMDRQTALFNDLRAEVSGSRDKVLDTIHASDVNTTRQMTDIVTQAIDSAKTKMDSNTNSLLDQIMTFRNDTMKNLGEIGTNVSEFRRDMLAKMDSLDYSLLIKYQDIMAEVGKMASLAEMIAKTQASPPPATSEPVAPTTVNAEAASSVTVINAAITTEPIRNAQALS